MHSSVYQIHGCHGSQTIRETQSGLDAASARRAATAANQRNADGLGLSCRAYRARSAGDEGWHFSARSGAGGSTLASFINRGAQRRSAPATLQPSNP